MRPAPIAQWLNNAATFSLPGPGVSRFFLTEEHRRLLDYLQEIMISCGLETTIDHSGNLIGRRVSTTSDKTLYIGSHQDSVPHGGAYDGILGICIALAVMWELQEQPLPFSVEIIVFGDEEGTRFNTTLLGSKAISGTFNKQVLNAVDDQGVTLQEGLIHFGLDPTKIPTIARNPATALAFIEVHIEQGPLLETQQLPRGIVSSITGIERHIIHIKGSAAHAGTVPMELRKDALVAASRYIQLVDSLCRQTEDLVGVIGKIEIQPNSVNVIPEEANFTVELRSPHLGKRIIARQHLAELAKELEEIGFVVSDELQYSQEAVTCDTNLINLFRNIFKQENISPTTLFSGAGHDGLAMARLCPIGMLFVRCKKGLSHHPDEATDINDAILATRVLKKSILQLPFKK